MRVATTYTLTWLPNADGTAPGDAWRAYRDPGLRPMPKAKSRNLTSQGKSGLTSQGESDTRNLSSQGESDDAQNLTAHGIHPYRNPLPGTPDTYSVLEGGAFSAGGVPLRAAAGKAGSR